MKAELRGIVAGAACVWLLAGCGGGASNGENSSDSDGGGAPRTFLQFNAATIPDDALRTCVNRLAQDHEWLEQGDVDAIVCGDVEIRSIQGLQAFPNLRTLKIAAPRLPVSEIPLLAALSLEDYQRKPFYKDGDESDPQNATVVMKTLLADGRPVIDTDQAVTLIALVSDDPGAERPELAWSAIFFDGTPGSAFEREQWDTGFTRVGAHTTLHWLRVKEGQQREYAGLAQFGDDHSTSEGFTPHWRHADARIVDAQYLSPELQACVNETAERNGWIYTWQVTALTCPQQGIDRLEGIGQFQMLERLDLRGNDLRFAYQVDSLVNLKHLDLRGNPLRSEVMDGRTVPDLVLLADPLVGGFDRVHLSIDDCGLKIEGFDPAIRYQLHNLSLVDNQLYGTFLFNFELAGALEWDAIANHDCAPLSLLSSGAWVVSQDGHSSRISSKNGFFLAKDGTVQQMFLFTGSAASGEVILSGQIADVFYSSETNLSSFLVKQWDTRTWRVNWQIETDLEPVHTHEGNVYLFDRKVREGQQPNRIARIDATGRWTELPTRPFSGIPLQVVGVDGQIWLLGLRDDWGSHPLVYVWDVVSSSWQRKKDLPSQGMPFGAFKSLDTVCVKTPFSQPASEYCWNEADGAWIPYSAPGSEGETLSVDGQLYRAEPRYVEDWHWLMGLYYMASSRIAPVYWVEEIIKNVRDVVSLDSDILRHGNLPLLQRFDETSEQWLPFGPPLVGIPNQVSATMLDGQMLVAFPKSIVRYGAPAQ